MHVSAIHHAAVSGSHRAMQMLQRGSAGPAVLRLQQQLAAAGFDPGGFDGKFGPRTEAALKKFQRAAKIVVDGKAGPQTWGALAKANAKPATPTPSAAAAPTLRPGSSGDHVRWMQALLRNHGFDPGGVDGKYGPLTRRAVVAFQLAHGLGGSGTVGPQTWALLSRPTSMAPPPGPSAPAPSTAPTAPTAPAPSAGITGMLDWAKSMVGTKYAAVNPFRFGEVLWDGQPHTSVNGSGSVYNFPKGTRVFDCSGFIVAAFKQLGVNLLSKNLATSWAFHANDGGFLQNVPREQLQPGDLITYMPKNGVGHVVIYLGEGKCVEAAGGVGVVVRDVKWDRFQSGRRVPVG